MLASTGGRGRFKHLLTFNPAPDYYDESEIQERFDGKETQHFSCFLQDIFREHQKVPTRKQSLLACVNLDALRQRCMGVITLLKVTSEPSSFPFLLIKA